MKHKTVGYSLFLFFHFSEESQRNAVKRRKEEKREAKKRAAEELERTEKEVTFGLALVLFFF